MTSAPASSARDDLLDSVGFISVGERGLVVRFTDRRVPEVRPTPVTEDLLALAHDPSEQYFVAVGRRGAVIRSDDNGLASESRARQERIYKCAH